MKRLNDEIFIRGDDGVEFVSECDAKIHLDNSEILRFITEAQKEFWFSPFRI